ncbi:MAG TPA: alkaline phosphatase family protein [Thermoanaerobaculia bacterium]|nr:alkaline phosphatase family protein [Thermoanaerobaculia bacterium]HUM29905.1 alkaline phosphatase family protein [Thermoanaerobaculia bacterium]HXK68228.1 alkaline phosphatase family protein [Thermoanaerobaculia bacterium]
MKKPLLFLIFLFLVSALASGDAPDHPRMIILGFDGVDHGYLTQYMEQGKLPNLSKLAQDGSFHKLLPPVPAQTPVSWSTFTTGLEPGQHLIFDFLKRDPETYMPTFAIADEIKVPVIFGAKNKIYLPILAGIAFFFLIFLLSWLLRRSMPVRLILGLAFGLIAAFGVRFYLIPMIPETRPGVDMHQQGEPFWQVMSRSGYTCKIFRMPVTFPAKNFPHGHLLSGLGVPDLSGRIGKPFFFTSDLFIPTATENEFSVEVVELPDNRGEMDTIIVGPPNKFFDEPDYIKLPMHLAVAEDRSHLTVKVCDQTVVLRPGEWSGWTDFVFTFNPIIKVRGVGRFYLDSLDPEINLYLSPINFDPRHLPTSINITYPFSWAKELVDRFGLYKTIGWSVDTWSPSEELTDEEFFMEEWQFNAEMYSKMLEGFIADGDDLLFQYFEFTDRVGHIFFRLLDEGHPAYDLAKANAFGSALEQSYESMDRIVGMTMENMPPDAKLIVLSDHGFASFRYATNYNTWLVQNGYMTLTGSENITQNLEALFDRGQFWPNVDWSRTRAYCMGLGGLYVNLKGRESKGIVEPGPEYEELRRELISRLEGWVDETTDLHPVAKVYTREEAYGTFNAILIPDMIVTNNPLFRVSWQTSLGGIPSQLIESNDQVWSGDHCSLYPPSVPGVLLTNWKMELDEDPYIVDLYPTILKMYNVSPPYEVAGKNLIP